LPTTLSPALRQALLAAENKIQQESGGAQPAHRSLPGNMQERYKGHNQALAASTATQENYHDKYETRKQLRDRLDVGTSRIVAAIARTRVFNATHN